MSRSLTIGAAGLCLVLAACGKPEGERAALAPPAVPEPVPNATINELMRLQAEPASDVVWGSVKTVSDATGIHEFRPSSPAEWQDVERSAEALVAFARYVAQPGRELVRSGVDLEAGGTLDTPAIRAKIAANHGLFAEKAAAFEDQARQVLAAVKARNAETLLDVGGPLQEACESCHLEFYYPGG